MFVGLERKAAKVWLSSVVQVMSKDRRIDRAVVDLMGNENAPGVIEIKRASRRDFVIKSLLSN